MSIRLYYDMHTDQLMVECVKTMQQNLGSEPTMKKRAKSVYQQRNLGTIKDRKREKRKQQEPTSGEMIMRILRMRYVRYTQLIVVAGLTCAVSF